MWTNDNAWNARRWTAVPLLYTSLLGNTPVFRLHAALHFVNSNFAVRSCAEA